MSIERPYAALVAVLVAFFAAWLLLRAIGGKRAEAFTYSNLAFLLDAAAVSQWPARIAAGALALGILLVAVSFAGVRLVMSLPSHDASVVLCLDTSGSMRATDIEPSREAAVRAAARSFVRSAPDGTRIGIVSFATGAQRIAGLSDDKQSITEALDAVPPANGATAIGDALQLAGSMLPVQGVRAIVLVTDGVNNNGADPQEAAESLGGRGIRIYTVGIGTNGSGLAIPGTTEEASIDDDALRAIAAAGHGTYTRTADATAIAGTLRNLARTTVWERRRVDISFALAIAGAGTMLLTFVGASLAGRFP